MTESDIYYKNLGRLTKSKEDWKGNIPYVASLLGHESSRIRVYS